MLTCKQVSYLASKKLDKKLTLIEQLSFFLHIMMCRLCREYAKDISALHKLVSTASRAGKMILPNSAKLSVHSRDRIKQVLDKVIDSKKY